MKMKPCSKCNGSGTEIDQTALGDEMRKKREAVGVSLRSVAEAMDYSAPYISDLELGRRNWSDGLLNEYNAALKRWSTSRAKKKESK